MYRQCELQHGETRTTAWLRDPRLKPGVHVVLHAKHDPEKRLWRVLSVSETRVETPPDMSWKVGGLT